MPSPTIERRAAGPASNFTGKGAGIRRYRMTVRARLALTYSALLTVAGAIMMTIVYLVMRFVPTYDFAATASEPARVGTMPPSDGPVGTGSPMETAGPIAGSSPAVPLDPANEFLINSPDQLFNLLLWISVLVLVLLAVAGTAVGWFMAGRMLKPLQYINTAVHRAATGDLAHRIALVGPQDEISELAVNFDDMLTKLEQSFTASRRFAQNASHELRTPLATTRAMLDVALVAPESPEQQKSLERLRIMNERSIETVAALLELASIDSSTAQPVAVDLADVAREVLDACRVETAGRGISVSAELAPAVVAGEPVLLRQMVANLVQNAIRHNHDGGSLTIGTGLGTGTGGDGAYVEVSNSGAVLDGRLVAELVEPFRKGAGRTAGAAGQAGGSAPRGHGLGLSIVLAVVDRHHGRLSLEPREGGGLHATVTMPRG